MYPQKTRTELVGDLLATALDEVVKGMPYIEGREIGYDPARNETYYDDDGPAPRFWRLADKYYQELEKEMGNENPSSLREVMSTPKAESIESN